MQQISYKCTSQQHHGKSAYISKNTVATMIIQLWKITNPRRHKGHPPPPPFPFSLSPAGTKRKENRKSLKAERGASKGHVCGAAHSEHAQPADFRVTSD